MRIWTGREELVGDLASSELTCRFNVVAPLVLFRDILFSLSS